MCTGIKEVSTTNSVAYICSTKGSPTHPYVRLIISFVENALLFQSSRVQTIVTSINVCALILVIVASGYLASKSGWVGYELPRG